MTKLNLQTLRELAKKATPGPWTPLIDHGYATVLDADSMWVVDCGEAPSASRDAAYIAAVSPDVALALLDQLAAMTAARDELADIAEINKSIPVPQAIRIAALRQIGSATKGSP